VVSARQVFLKEHLEQRTQSLPVIVQPANKLQPTVSNERIILLSLLGVITNLIIIGGLLLKLHSQRTTKKIKKL